MERTSEYLRLIVEGHNQTSEGLNEVWRDAFNQAQHIISASNVNKILILGLGAGGKLKDTYTAFPHAAITAIEHDPEMISIAKKSKLYEPFPLPYIIEKDAEEALMIISQRFELIFLDIFRGGTLSTLLLKDRFITLLKEKMARKSVLLVNVASKEQYLELFPKHFAVEKNGNSN